MRKILAILLVLLVSANAFAQGAVSVGKVGGVVPVYVDHVQTHALTKRVCVTPTITTGSAYAQYNVVGGLLKFTGILDAQLSTGSAYVTVTDATNTTSTNYTIWLFYSNPTHSTVTDKSALAINIADVPLVTNASNVGLSKATATGVPYAGTVAITNSLITSSTADVYAILQIASGTPTWTNATDIQVCITVVNN